MAQFFDRRYPPQIILNKLNAKMTHPFMDFRTHENTLTFPWRLLSPLSLGEHVFPAVVERKVPGDRGGPGCNPLVK